LQYYFLVDGNPADHNQENGMRFNLKLLFRWGKRRLALFLSLS